MSRISLSDTIAGAIAKLADGQPLATLALQASHTLGSRIDPDAGDVAGFRTMQTLDDLGIYGEELQSLFADACGMNPTNLAAFCRAVQLGQLGREEALAIARGHAPANMSGIIAGIQSSLPNFGRCQSCDCEKVGTQRACADDTGVF